MKIRRGTVIENLEGYECVTRRGEDADGGGAPLTVFTYPNGKVKQFDGHLGNILWEILTSDYPDITEWIKRREDADGMPF